MRILSIVLAFVAFGVGVVFFYARYDRYQQNQRIEAQNVRKADSNKLVKAINGLDSRSRDCSDWFVGLTTGQYAEASTTDNVAISFSETCASSMVTRADELGALISRLADKDPEPGRASLLAESRALAEVYRSQSDDFDKAYTLMIQASGPSARASLAPQVAQLINRAIPAINRSLSALEDARKSYIYPES
ncbi:hypothetical protein ANTHELSMS3_03183 [Antarctobacter heliothermus]|uniref:Uncharacterized protein n=1 Tax=Antarctobacter heliothermus TaxID=74033 RepID=A0A222E6J0_9RHOB|nr:hypothetical protein [Antarctobacter heliothermus]ASP21833.1 hypothetical protein ANTHELSMS3_03183 [Antarctobacter heliothermus]